MKYFSIGEFSQLTNTSITKLRYYDQLGILIPASIGTNNYRYYKYEQTHQLELIFLLKSFGINLKEIKKYNKYKLTNNLLINIYKQNIVDKKKEIENLEFNFNRIIKKEKIKQNILDKKDNFYFRKQISGIFLVLQIEKEPQGKEFYIKKELYNLAKKTKRIERLYIMQKGWLYCSTEDKAFQYIELVNKEDRKIFGSENIKIIPSANFYCSFSKLKNINLTVERMLAKQNKTSKDVLLIILDKLLENNFGDKLISFEIQILFK